MVLMIILCGQITQVYLPIVMPIILIYHLNMGCFLVHWVKALSHLHSLRSTSFVYGGACCSLGCDPPLYSVTLGSFVCLIQLLMLMLFCVCWHLFSSSGNPLVTSAFITENLFAIAIGAISLILFAQLIGKMQVVP